MAPAAQAAQGRPLPRQRLQHLHQRRQADRRGGSRKRLGVPRAAASDELPKVAAITGGTRGIGLGIAHALARDGYNLILGYNSNTEVAEAAAAELQAAHGIQVVCTAGDLAEAAALEAMVGAAHARFGGSLTAFVHNAGLWPGLTTARTPAMPGPEYEDAAFEAMFHYFFRVYPVVFKRGLVLGQACRGFRHAVAVSMPGCNATQVPRVQSEPSGQGKAAMEYLVRVNALKLGPQGITVNAVIPGIIETEAWARSGAAVRSEAESGIYDMPLQRWGTRADVGAAVAFLCSERGSFITGVALPVDGGRHLVGTTQAKA